MKKKKTKEERFLENIAIHEKIIKKYVMLRIGHMEDAMDIVQEVMERAWRNMDDLNSDENALSWLKRIAENRMIDYWRARARNNDKMTDHTVDNENGELISLIDMIHANEDVLNEIIYNSKKEILRKIIEELPTRDKDLIIMRFYMEYSYEEIGKIFGISENYVGVQLHRALKKLRKMIERSGKEEWL